MTALELIVLYSVSALFGLLVGVSIAEFSHRKANKKY